MWSEVTAIYRKWVKLSGSITEISTFLSPLTRGKTKQPKRAEEIEPRNAPRLEQSTKLGVRSSEGNLDLDLNMRILDLQSNAIRKRISTLRYLFLDSFSLRFFWGKSEKRFEKVLKNSGLVRARIISKKKTTVHENSFANPFLDFPIERLKGKIHEIWIWIS